MEFNKLILKSDLAHFKNSMNGKNQNTYEVPPLSTIVGILKNIYGEDVSDFVFGYTCEFHGKFKDVTTIYKEINLNVAPKSKRFASDICFIEYLVNPIVTIYHNIDKKPVISEILNLGKTNCLAKCDFQSENITEQNSIGYNQWCPISIGHGIIERINKETIYNPKKGYYDYYNDLFRFNTEFESNYTLEEKNEGIQLWKYKGVGDIECYQEKL